MFLALAKGPLANDHVLVLPVDHKGAYPELSSSCPSKPPHNTALECTNFIYLLVIIPLNIHVVRLTVMCVCV